MLTLFNFEYYNKMRKVKYSLDDVRKAIGENKSIAGVLRQLGLKPIGGNYRTINRIIRENNMDTSHFTGQGGKRRENQGLHHHAGRHHYEKGRASELHSG